MHTIHAYGEIFLYLSIFYLSIYTIILLDAVMVRLLVCLLVVRRVVVCFSNPIRILLQPRVQLLYAIAKKQDTEGKRQHTRGHGLGGRPDCLR